MSPARRPLRRLATLVSLVAIAVAVALPVAAEARTLQLKGPVSFTFFNACFGLEEFTVDGTMHVVASEDGSRSLFRIVGKGTAADGTRYHFQSHSIDNTAVDGQGADHASFVSKVTIGRQGNEAPGDDVVQRIHTHVTLNANGEVTVAFDRFEAGCH